MTASKKGLIAPALYFDDPLIVVAMGSLQGCSAIYTLFGGDVLLTLSKY
jgi:hypothetical protein